MTTLTIRRDGDPILRAKAVDVADFDEALAKLAIDMGETMVAYNGVGLAAPQVGHSIRLIVLAEGSRNIPPLVMVNPDIRSASDYQRSEEGCLSVPKSKWGAAVMRRKRIVVYYRDLLGAQHRRKAAGPFACVIQHEVDHLNGVLFTDYSRRAAMTSF